MKKRLLTVMTALCMMVAPVITPLNTPESSTRAADWEPTTEAATTAPTAPAVSDGTATSGYCGANLTWNYNLNTKTLRIDGTGPMYDWSSHEDVPWRKTINYYNIEPREVIISPGVTSIGDNAFFCFRFVSSFSIPDTVTRIGIVAFGACYDLSSITIPGSVKIIDDSAFENCTYLRSVELQDGVQSIAGAAFFGCENLENIRLPNSLQSIASGAFMHCSSLTTITIPAGMTDIQENFVGRSTLSSTSIFIGCSALSSIYVSPDNPAYTSVDGVLFTKDMKKLLRYPENKSGSSYTIPESVTELAGGAFVSCDNLTSITVPAGVNSMGTICFDDYYYDRNKNKGIYNVRKDLTLYVTSGSFAEEYASIEGIRCVASQPATQPATQATTSTTTTSTRPTTTITTTRRTTTSTRPTTTTSTTRSTTTTTRPTTTTSTTRRTTTSTRPTTSTSTTRRTTSTTVATTTTTTTAPAPQVEPYSTGDVTGDAVINAKDANAVLIAAAKLGTGNASGLTAEADKAADVNSDGTINAKDANAILRYAAAAGTGKATKITDYI